MEWLDLTKVAGIVPIVVAFVQVIRLAAGDRLPTRWAPFVSMGVGLALSVLVGMAQGVLTAQGLSQAAVLGLLAGMSASGLYDVAKTKPAEPENTIPPGRL